MATAVIGSVTEFCEDEDTFQNYVERLEQFFIANGIVDDVKKRAVLLSSVGAKTYKLVGNLLAPRKAGDCPYSEIVSTLTNHHNPRPSTIVQRFRFNSRTRLQGETVRQFVAELRKLSEYCDFEEKLDEMLRDRLVCGINETKTQQRLLSEPQLTFAKALEIAQAMEAAVDGANEITHSSDSGKEFRMIPAPDSVNVVGRRESGRDEISTPVKSTHNKRCYRCGGPHTPNVCKFKYEKCFGCQKTGHVSKMCQQRNQAVTHRNARQKQNKTHVLSGDECESDLDCLFTLRSSVPPLYVDVQVNGCMLTFQVDTGASRTVINKQLFTRHINSPLKKTTRSLRTYTGEAVNIFGEADVEVSHEDKTVTLPLLVVGGNGPSLLGRDWLKHLNIDLSIFNIDNHEQKLQDLLNQHASVFQDSPGCLRDVTVTLHVDANAQPKFCKPRQPPYALRDSIEEELNRLQRDGIIAPVEFSEWATPIVPVRKKDGTIRICGDYKTTVNRVTKSDNYPIPRIEDLAYALSSGEKFTKLDFSHAYTQLQLDVDSQKLTTINTHKGLFTYQRLCFGIAAAPGIFQRTIEGLFRHVPNCVNYLDDLYVTGKDDKEHLENLNKVLSICQERGMSLRRDKCEFMKKEVEFLGYRLDKRGIHPLDDKVSAIKNAPIPKNVQELRAFLGMLNYYGKFIHNVSSILAPLHVLLRKEHPWCWGEKQMAAFRQAKRALSSDRVLLHFDPKRQIVISCDASPVGVAAVLSQVDDNGDEKPVAYASRTLTPAERNYAQLDREGLSIVFAMKKWHKFVLGQQIRIVTDHKPLLGLFGEGKPIPEHASARVQRWAIILSAYSYTLEYRPGRENNADALSRLPLRHTGSVDDDTPEDINAVFSVLEKIPLSAQDIAAETQKDLVLKQILVCVMSGWPERMNKDERFRPYASRKNEMSVEGGCLLWGTRVVIPSSLQEKVLKMLHDDTHVGVAKMKAQARSWVWWPQIDANIEKGVKACYTCQVHSNTPAKAPLHPWEWPEEPWKRIHLDFAGPFMGKMFLIIVDAHSKWLEVKVMHRITASDTILELRDVFSSLGLPEIIVSDNGPTFTSGEFRSFLSHNGIKHITVSPYHPSSNGLAERSVQTFKRAMVKMNGGSLREKVYKFLTKYRCTPHSTTGLAPAELMFGRNIRTHLDLLHPTLIDSVSNRQQAQKQCHDKTAKDRAILVNDSVLVRNFSQRGDKWVPGVVVETTGPVSYKVRTASLGIVRRHRDQVRVTSSHDDATDVVGMGPEPSPPTTDNDSNQQENERELTPVQCVPNTNASDQNTVTRTRSGRIVRAPERYDPSFS